MAAGEADPFFSKDSNSIPLGQSLALRWGVDWVQFPKRGFVKNSLDNTRRIYVAQEVKVPSGNAMER
jgi:hypothetical protein